MSSCSDQIECPKCGFSFITCELPASHTTNEEKSQTIGREISEDRDKDGPVKLYVVTEFDESDPGTCLVVGVYTTAQQAQDAIKLCNQDDGVERGCQHRANHMQLNEMPGFIHADGEVDSDTIDNLVCCHCQLHWGRHVDAEDECECCPFCGSADIHKY